MMVDPMFVIVQSLGLFLTAVTPTAVAPEVTWIYLNLPGFTWIDWNLLDLPLFTEIYLHLSKFTWIYLNLPKLTWIYPHSL